MQLHMELHTELHLGLHMELDMELHLEPRLEFHMELHMELHVKLHSITLSDISNSNTIAATPFLHSVLVTCLSLPVWKTIIVHTHNQ